MNINLHDYDLILINSSGGKDSQTMLRHVVQLADDQGYPRSQMVVAHADLGEMEWVGTRNLAELQASLYGLRFEAIKRPQGDLLTHVEERGMWPSNTARYCTSDHKRGQIRKVITKLDREWRTIHAKPMFRVLNCMGLRAQESSARAKKVAFSSNKKAGCGTRTVNDWLPILDWSEDEVWSSIKDSGVPYHPAYDLGMPRLSCVFCIFAPKNALILAGKHNRPLLDRYVEVEERIDHKFRMDVSLAEIRDAVESDEVVGEMSGAWNM